MSIIDSHDHHRRRHTKTSRHRVANPEQLDKHAKYLAKKYVRGATNVKSEHPQRILL